MEDKYATFLAALAGLGDTPTPSTRDEAMLAALVDRLASIAAAASASEFPDLPSEDGEYALTLTISSGTPVLSWESTT